MLENELRVGVPTESDGVKEEFGGPRRPAGRELELIVVSNITRFAANDELDGLHQTLTRATIGQRPQEPTNVQKMMHIYDGR